MRGRRTSSEATAVKNITSHSTSTPATAPSARPDLALSNEALLRRKYRQLIRRHLGRLLDNLFAEFTGLHFHISWAPSSTHEWLSQHSPTACSVCCQLSGSPLLPDCKTCGRKQLARALSTHGEGHRFTCRLGVRNCWYPIRVRGETLGIAYLQALDHSTARLPARARRHLIHRKAVRVMGHFEFIRAARLLQLIVQHVQLASLAELRKTDLTNAGRAVLTLEKEQARLHDVLQRYLPITPQTPCRAAPQSHPEQLVHRLLECIEQHYGEPITLRNCARKLGVNPAYASALFSRAVGVPFKTHLTELRLEKAKALLSDPAKSVSEAAVGVGYASENRFRIAFKKATGLAPRIWRETVHTNPTPS